MKITRIYNAINDYETWMTPTRKVLLKNGNIEIIDKIIIGQEIYDIIDGAYLGIVVEVDNIINE